MPSLVTIDSQTSQLDIHQLEHLLKTAKAANKHCEIDWVNRTIQILSEKIPTGGVSGKIYSYQKIIMCLNG